MTIAGLQVVALRVIGDERGAVMHMMRADAPHFSGFGEIYFSSVKGGVVKGWRRHTRMTASMAVPVGRVRLIVFDDRPGSATCGEHADVMLGEDDYKLVVVPPGLWTAFQGVVTGPSLIANCASILHETGEAETRPLSDAPLAIDWDASWPPSP